MMARLEDDDADLGEYDDEEYEIEDVADDTPMHIYEHVFLGSIDAARNHTALARAHIGVIIGLLGTDDERIVDTEAEHGSSHLMRVLVDIEDSADEPLFLRLPALLATLQQNLADVATWDDNNVLVHCMAGRSRSPSLVVAWMMTTHNFSFSQALEHIEMIRPWIAINPRFRRDLELFNSVVHFTPPTQVLDPDHQALLMRHRAHLPRLDFGVSLVTDIVAHKKTVTMRLPSDIENDCNSDLARIRQYTTVVATTASRQDNPTREPFAFLRIDRVDANTTLASIDETMLTKTGFGTKTEVMNILKTFYPEVTMETSLLLLSFTCLGRSE